MMQNYYQFLHHFIQKISKKGKRHQKNQNNNSTRNLTEGDIQSCVKIYEDYTKIFNASDFFDRILKPVMYRIGDEWATGKD